MRAAMSKFKSEPFDLWALLSFPKQRNSNRIAMKDMAVQGVGERRGE